MLQTPLHTRFDIRARQLYRGPILRLNCYILTRVYCGESPRNDYYLLHRIGRLENELYKSICV